MTVSRSISAWYNLAEAKAILQNVTPSDLSIATSNSGKSLIWVLRNDLENRLENLRYRSVDRILGFSIDDDDLTLDQQDLWYRTEEEQASIHDRLRIRWGDPDILLGYGPETANRLWKKDPNCIARISKIRRDTEQVQRDITAKD